MENQDHFYLGRIYDPLNRQTTEQPLLYDPADLTTHAVVVGMTGSGKTGLCINLIEEAALSGIPALMVDLKGDITNALLHFPNLAPQDFEPWVNPDEARRQGKSVEQAAAEAAQTWRRGLEEWGISKERLHALRNAAQYAVYTPGSDVGIPVSILASLKAPPIPWEENKEILREKISATVTALLGLVGLKDIDPVRSREHILLANIFERAWSQGRNLDLSELILQTQSPPFDRLGVFDVNTFFPEKERFSLAMLLNNILAAPAFQTWIEGQPLDVDGLLFAPDGGPQHSVFYIAHLTDAERMFFVTLLFSAVEAWMRTQPGTGTLRALVYFDEIFGYLPPTANPASKQPMLNMLKQARAFGVGLILATQNPVDVDYKALSNAGTWLIGKLQTGQDKERLMDGLESAMAGGLDRSQFDRLISALDRRVFLMNNVHAKGPQLFQARWAMNYLAGPLVRAQIPVLNELVGATHQAASAPTGEVASRQVALQTSPVETGPTASQEARGEVPDPGRPFGAGFATRPAIPARVAEYFLPNNLAFTQALDVAGIPYTEEAQRLGLLYRPFLLAQANVRFLQRKYNLDAELVHTALVVEPDQRGRVRWEEFTTTPFNPQDLEAAPDPQARFAALEAPLSDAKILTALKKDFEDWVYRTSQVAVRANEALKVYVGPEVTYDEFRRMCSEGSRRERDSEAEKVVEAFGKKIKALKTRLGREERELREDEAELSQRRMEELGTHAENILGLFGRSKRRISTSLTKRRMTKRAKAEVEESREVIEEYTAQITKLENEKAEALEEVNRKWAEIADQVSEIPITPYRKDVRVELFGVAWKPFYVAQAEGRTFELPGFDEEVNG